MITGSLIHSFQKAQELGPSETSRHEPRGISEIKFVVDSMANGLGQKLRQCGFDTILVANRQLVINTCLVDPSYVAISCGKGAKQVRCSIHWLELFSSRLPIRWTMRRFSQFRVTR